MNAKVSELFEQIKELALHEASELLAVLAGHVSESVKTAASDQPCPQGYVKNSKGECVPDVG